MLALLTSFATGFAEFCGWRKKVSPNAVENKQNETGKIVQANNQQWDGIVDNIVNDPNVLPSDKTPKP